MLVGIPYKKTDRAACTLSLEHSGKNLHLVALLSSCRYLTLTRFTAVKLALDKVEVNVYASREAVDDSANTSSMTFAKGCYRKYIAKRITHREFLS